MIDVLSLVPAAEGRQSEFAAAGFRLTVIGKATPPRAAVAAANPKTRAVVTSGMIGLSADEIGALPDLEIIATIGAGFDKIDVDAARTRGIVTTNGPGTNADTVADHAMALLFAIVRDIAHFDSEVRAGRDWSSLRQMRPGLWQKRLGVAGLGQIGSRVAVRAAGGFDMMIGYHNRRPVDGCAHRYFSDVTTLADWADFLVVTLPGTAESRHIVNRDVLAALGPFGFIVNVGRGSAVNTDDLLLALRTNTIAGAGLDVFEGEPIVPDEIRTLSNVIVTPHIAGRSPESTDRMFQLAIENLKAHFSGRPVLTPIEA